MKTLKTRTLLPALALLSLALLPAASCPPGAAQTAESTIPSDIGFTVCSADQYEADQAKGVTNAGQIVADVIAQCSAQLAQIIATVATPLAPEAVAATYLGQKVATDMVTGRLSQADANARLAGFFAAAKLPAPKLLVLPARGAR